MNWSVQDVFHFFKDLACSNLVLKFEAVQDVPQFQNDSNLACSNLVLKFEAVQDVSQFQNDSNLAFSNLELRGSRCLIILKWFKFSISYPFKFNQQKY